MPPSKGIMAAADPLLTYLPRRRDMPYPWRKALCERTRLSDSVFLGEMLSIICE